MKKRVIIGIVIIAAILLILACFAIYYFLFNNRNQSIINENNTDDYYANLLKKCPVYQYDNCCRNSVEEMAKGGYKEPVDGKCPLGYMDVIAMCDGAIPFCYKPEIPEINSVEDCLKMKQNNNSIYNPVAYSNMPKDPKDYVNESTRKADSCIFDFVDKHKEITDQEVCNKIVSPYYFYLCRQRIAFNNNDSSLCNIEFLGKQSNVNGCFNVLSVRLKNSSLCNMSSEPEVCLSGYDYVYNNGTAPINRLG